MKTDRFRLDVQAANNGWVIYATNSGFLEGQLLPPAWVCADDASLAETIAAALVALKLDAANNLEPQTIPTNPYFQHNSIISTSIADSAITANRLSPYILAKEEQAAQALLARNMGMANVCK